MTKTASIATKIERAANLKQINALLGGTSIVERSAQGECFWLQDGQIITSGSFATVRGIVADALRYRED